MLEQCALASNAYEFEKAMEKYNEIGGAKASEYMSDKPYDHWADLFFFPEKRYGENKNNVAESFNTGSLD